MGGFFMRGPVKHFRTGIVIRAINHQSIIIMKSIIAIAAAICIGSLSSNAQTFGHLQKEQVINALGQKLANDYYSEKEGKRLRDFLQNQSKKRVYDKISDGPAFASALTQHLQDQAKDRHLRVEFSPDVLPPDNRTEIMSIPESEKKDYGNMLRRTNYGIRKVEVLRGNIGYIDFEAFTDPEFASDTYVGMMQYLSHTEALIIDLRHCGGSRSPHAVPFLLSYFFSEPVKLEEIYWRKADAVTQSWTSAVVPGEKYLNKPVYVLTSNNTFSGAEAIVAALKKYKRATIIGQNTGGGSHPGGIVRLSDHFQAYISVGKIAGGEHSIGDWETDGIRPDIAINTKLALIEAQQLAMKNSITATDEEIWKNALAQWSAELEAQKPVFKTVRFELTGSAKAKEVQVAGTFSEWAPVRMEKVGENWIASVECETGKQRYKYIVDGKWILDPDNAITESHDGNTDSIMSIE